MLLASSSEEPLQGRDDDSSILRHGTQDCPGTDLVFLLSQCPGPSSSAS